MTCTSCQQRLSAYLDGELADADASALRGHLRTCAACSADATREAELIDGMRQLPSLDPPPAMWQAIRSQLAHEEIADAEASRAARLWRKVSAWVSFSPTPWLWHGVGGVAVASAAVVLLWWSRGPEAPAASQATARDSIAERAEPSLLAAAPAVVATAVPGGEPIDVAVALTDELAMIDHSYREAVSELVEMIGEARPSWNAAYARRHDDKVRELRARVDSEPSGRAKERAWQELMRYLQTTLTRSELAMGAQ